MKYARANIIGGKEYPEIRGCVFFKETTDGVLLTAQIKGLPQSNDNCKGRFFHYFQLKVANHQHEKDVHNL